MTAPGLPARKLVLNKIVRSSRAMTTIRLLALASLALASGCSSFHYAPVANWARDGGRLCALDRDPAFDERASPRACAQTFNDATTEDSA